MTRILRIALPAAAVLALVLASTQPVMAKPPACGCNICVAFPPSTLCTDLSTGDVEPLGLWCGAHCAVGTTLAELTPTVVAAAPPARETVSEPALDPRTPEPAAISVCLKSYCADVGLRCINSGTGPRGCCRYDDCNADMTCTGVDPLPPNICKH